MLSCSAYKYNTSRKRFVRNLRVLLEYKILILNYYGDCSIRVYQLLKVYKRVLYYAVVVCMIITLLILCSLRTYNRVVGMVP